MTAIETYLVNLRNKIFKLLPMRESFDSGIDNHLPEYLDNLLNNCQGAFVCYANLSAIKEFVEVCNNLAYMREEVGDIDFGKWRSMVLRSTRLVQTILARNYGEV